MTKCEKGKIINPKTGRCVSKTGAIGIKLTKNAKDVTKSVATSVIKPDKTITLSKLRDLTLLTKKPVKKTNFKGRPNIIYKCMKYIGEKHKDVACVITKQNKINSNLVRKTDFAFVWNSETEKLFVPKNMFKEIKNCKKRFVVCYLSLMSHANILIFDNVNKTLERFEPHGENTSYIPEKLDNALISEFNKNFGDIKYITPLDFCPIISFQRKEKSFDKLKNDPNGFCVAWSIWYADMRLTSPDIPRDKLVNIAIDKIENKHKSFKNFIRNYSKFLVDETKVSRKSVRKSKKSSRKSVRKSKKSSRKSVRKSKKASRKSVRKSKKSSRKSVRKSKKSSRKSVRKSKKSSRKSKKSSRKSKKSSRKSVRKSKKASRKSVRKSKKSSRKSKKSSRKSVRKSKKSSRKSVRKSKKSSRKSVRKSKK
jgi:hypothetical protein